MTTPISNLAGINAIPNSSKITGAIRKLKDHFGFIAGDDGSDYFFHWSAMEKTGKDFRDLVERERVEFFVVRMS